MATENEDKTMKYLTATTLSFALMACGFGSLGATPAQASTIGDDRTIYSESDHENEVNDIDPLEQLAINDDDRFEDCTWSVNQDGMKMCSKTDENGSEVVAGIEVPKGVEFAGCVEREDGDYVCTGGWKSEDGEGEKVAQAHINASVCAMFPTIPECQGKAEEAEGEQFACSGTDYIYGCRPTKTPTGTFYPLPMIDVASMDKLLAPGGTSVASFDKILAPGGTAIDSDHQFADREDGSGGSFGNSGGGDFGDGDRAAAGTAAE